VHAKLGPPVNGGETRQASVLAGLRALAGPAPDHVLIHDAVRPFVSADLISRVLAALAAAPAAICALPLADTLKRAGADGRIAGTLDRTGLWRAQTPQGFRFADILAAHEAAAAAGRTDFTDDAAIAEWAGLAVALVPGSEANAKLTTAEDLAMADRALAPADVRTGIGFDVHRFAPGDHVWLCGVRIPHSHRLEGHSDADVALHALTDAILGAIGDGDIGQHFADTDPRWKGAASHLFLADALSRARARGGSIGNVDVTLLCEAPRIAAHRDAMRARIAEILQISVDRVGVKATTTERLGFLGRGEGIAAMATATVILR
jgi:2-C-methyl-D-erythritol 4-phosphate cytidylyltransferase/2-C-methyl-D-erythritol 2,4-cyclodiphosphate synthase